MSYSTQRISTKLLEEIRTALRGIQYGSVEIYIQDKKVTQITVRNIKKTKLDIDQEGKQNGQMQTRPNSSSNGKLEVLTLSE